MRGDATHLIWLVTAVVALALGIALLASARARSWLARTRLFTAVFGERHPERARWLAGFYLFTAAWGFVLFLAASS